MAHIPRHRCQASSGQSGHRHANEVEGEYADEQQWVVGPRRQSVFVCGAQFLDHAQRRNGGQRFETNALVALRVELDDGVVGILPSATEGGVGMPAEVSMQLQDDAGRRFYVVVAFMDGVQHIRLTMSGDISSAGSVV